MSAQVTIAGDSLAFAPGDEIRGLATWDLYDPPKRLEIRLFWYTKGKGTRDASVIDVTPIANPSQSGQADFTFTLPLGPYSFSGRLISLIWAIELVIEPHGQSAHQDFILSPTREEIVLPELTQST